MCFDPGDASNSENFKNILDYSDSLVASKDIIGNSSSSIYNARETRVLSGNYLRTLNWYDNE